MSDKYIDKVIKEYNEGYEKLTKDILEHKDDFEALKKDAKEIEEKYIEIFKWNNKNMYNNYMDKAPKAIFALITRDGLKKYMDLEVFRKRLVEIGKEEMAKSSLYAPYIVGLREDFMEEKYVRYAIREILGEENYKEIHENTEGEFKLIEEANEDVVILSLEPETCVSNANETRAYCEVDVAGEFRHLRGLRYYTTEAKSVLYLVL